MTYPIVQLAGSEEWEGYWEFGERLDVAFPGQEGHDFASAANYNDSGPLADESLSITGLWCAHRGYNDGDDWVWIVDLSDGSQWWMKGGCDFTGWDCQSNNEWAQV